MSDLISREETISYIENWKEVNKYYHPYTKNTNIPIDEVIQVIKDVPSNNQKIGHWIEHEIKTVQWVECSECHITYKFKTRHCPNCGAKMEGE